MPHRKPGYLLNCWDSSVAPEEILRSLRVGAREVDRVFVVPSLREVALDTAENIFSTKHFVYLGEQSLGVVSF